MADPAAFPWPPLRSGEPPPSWDGVAFRLGGQRVPVLEYSRNETGWDASLTGLHEEAASTGHPIDIASRRAATGGLRRFLPPDADVILEVGTSSGFLLPLMREAFPRACIIGSDAFPQALRQLADRSPGWPLLQFDLTRCPLPDACLDAVVALNVLEHIEDDARALAELHRILKPGGIAYVEVPAGRRLYDVYDRLLRHHRRYSAAELRQKAVAAGMRVEWISHLGFLPYPAFAAVKRRNRRLLSGTAEEQRAEVARLITASRGSAGLAMALRLEALLGRVVRFPFGIRCVCVLRRPAPAAPQGVSSR